jgi:hypothetical protein
MERLWIRGRRAARHACAPYARQIVGVTVRPRSESGSPGRSGQRVRPRHVVDSAEGHRRHFAVAHLDFMTDLR